MVVFLTICSLYLLFTTIFFFFNLAMSRVWFDINYVFLFNFCLHVFIFRLQSGD